MRLRTTQLSNSRWGTVRQGGAWLGTDWYGMGSAPGKGLAGRGSVRFGEARPGKFYAAGHGLVR